MSILSLICAPGWGIQMSLQEWRALCKHKMGLTQTEATIYTVKPLLSASSNLAKPKVTLLYG